MADNKQITFRRIVREADLTAVREIVTSTGFFHDYEIEIAVELVEEVLAEGEESGYYFLFAESEEELLGYTCFGKIPCTVNSYDIYWIAVHNHQRGKGTGGLLLSETERIIREMGGNGVVLETSSTEKYLPTRNFYQKYQYLLEASITDFYDYGDDKVIYVKRLNPRSNG